MTKNLYRIAVLLLFSICYGRLSAQQLAPSIVWKKCLGGTKDDRAYTIVRAIDGGYIIGGSSKSNDGDITGHHGSTDSTDAWLVKLDADGNIQWQKSLGGTGNDEIDHIIPTNDGGYMALGATNSNNNGDVSGYQGQSQYDIEGWLVKLDRYGTIQWQKCLTYKPSSIRQTADSGYILGGGAATIMKLDKFANVQWSRTLTGTGTAGHDVLPLSTGGYLFAVLTDGYTGDFANICCGYTPYAVLVTLDANGNTVDMKMVGNQSMAYGFQKVDDGHFYLLSGMVSCYRINQLRGFNISLYNAQNLQVTGGGGYYNRCIYDPNLIAYGFVAKDVGSMTLRSNGSGVVAGLTSDTLGGLINHGGPSDGLLGTFNPQNWSKCYGGSGEDNFQEVTSDDDYTYIAAGSTNSNDGDVSGNHGGYDCWIVKVGNVNVIKGTVFLDYNLNGARDGGEPLVDNVLVQSSKGSSSSGSSTYNGVFYNTVDTGTYTTKVISPLPFYTPSAIDVPSSFHSYNNTDSLSFALQPIPGKRDYSVQLFSEDFVRAGFDATFQVVYNNKGTDTFTNGKVQFIKDHRYAFLSASPAQSAISGDTITWIISSLAPRQSGTILVHLNLAAPPVTHLGDTIISMATIDSSGDLAPGDNIALFRRSAFSSYDPNDKEEANGGVIYKDELQKGKPLLYTIHFQNTGNDTAFTVVVRDTLDTSKVDPATLEMVGASHPYQLSIVDGNKLKWTFAHILLPDSTRNAKASQGYLAYKIKPMSSVAEGDTIRNTANIYFDYNLPVATNMEKTVVSHVVVPPSPAPTISGLQISYCSTDGVQKIKVTNVPAPSYQASVTVKVDDVAAAMASDSSIALRIDTLTAGVHTIRVVFQNTADTSEGMWTFRIYPMVTPAVDLSSNITEVTDLSRQVVLTATNTSGGGASPLYTFAKDRGFTSILQAEGVSNTLTFDPSLLQVGSNMVYVRMKTSEIFCYTAQTAVDSVVILRSAVTGLVDIDYPGQVININPNPFGSRVYVTGLQVGKTYFISLVNSNGQTIVRKKVSGQQEAVLDTGVLAKGIYLLRIYDQKKNRLIGSAKLLSTGR